MNAVITEIFNTTQFTKDELLILSSKLNKKQLSQKDFLISSGDVVNHFYYVYSGCLRTYYIDNSGKEHTLQFAIKGWWISDYIALFGRQKTNAVSYVECIKEATVYKISKKEFDEICLKMPIVSHLHIRNLEIAFANFQQRILDNLNLSAKERYLKFMETYPTIEQHIKNYHIASFLGITTESLSRIRKEMTNL